jgi:hypothetical protein
MVSVTGKVNRMKNGGEGIFVRFGEGISGTEVTNPVSVLGLSPDESVGFRDNFLL